MVQEIAHQMALLPVLVLIYVISGGGVPKRDFALLTMALFMSWIGDSLGGQGYSWAVAQIGFAYAAVVGDWNFKRVMLVGLVCGFTFVVAPMYGFGELFWGIGGIGLVFFGRNTIVQIPIFIYFGAGTMAYMFMIQEPTFRSWLIYQACRLVALASLSVLILKNYRREPAHVVVYN